MSESNSPDIKHEPPKFGDPKAIAWEKTPAKDRRKILASPDGYNRYSVQHNDISQKDFEHLFGELTPELEVGEKEISLQGEEKLIPQYTLPKGTIILNGWYGDPETEELGRIENEKGKIVDILGVRRPEKDKGPAPSWKVQETRVGKNGDLIKEIYYVGRRGKLFIGEEIKK